MVFLVLEVEPKTRSRRKRPSSDLTHFEGAKLGLWEEGRVEGKPSTHTVYSRLTIVACGYLLFTAGKFMC